MHLRAELQAGLVMVEPKDRAEAIRQWEDELYAPLGGWEQAQNTLYRELGLSPV